jgi:hypothetical protein
VTLWSCPVYQCSPSSYIAVISADQQQLEYKNGCDAHASQGQGWGTPAQSHSNLSSHVVQCELFHSYSTSNHNLCPGTRVPAATFLGLMTLRPTKPLQSPVATQLASPSLLQPWPDLQNLIKGLSKGGSIISCPCVGRGTEDLQDLRLHGFDQGHKLVVSCVWLCLQGPTFLTPVLTTMASMKTSESSQAWASVLRDLLHDPLDLFLNEKWVRLEKRFLSPELRNMPLMFKAMKTKFLKLFRSSAHTRTWDYWPSLGESLDKVLKIRPGLKRLGLASFVATGDCNGSVDLSVVCKTHTMVCMLKSSPWERFNVILGSWIPSIVTGWLIQTFYWLKPKVWAVSSGEYPTTLTYLSKWLLPCTDFLASISRSSKGWLKGICGPCPNFPSSYRATHPNSFLLTLRFWLTVAPRASPLDVIQA